MNRELVDLLQLISRFSVLLPLVVGGYFFVKREFSKAQHRVFLLVVIGVVTELAIYLLNSYKPDTNNLPGLHLYTLIQFVLLTLAFSDHLRRLLGTATFRVLFAVAILTAIGTGFFIDGIFNYNTTFRAIQCVLMVVVGASYLFRLLREMNVVYLESDPLFWLASGVVLYFSGNFLVFLIAQTYADQHYYFWTFYSIHSILNILLNLFYAIVLWVNPNR